LQALQHFSTLRPSSFACQHVSFFLFRPRPVA
jgi:hypothetical protein